MKISSLFFSLLLAQITCVPLLAQQHVTDAPQVLEGPQRAGVAAKESPVDGVMSNDTVLQMHAAGLSDDLILQSIESQPGSYNVLPNALIHLRESGISNVVLSAMTAKGRRRLTNLSTPVVNIPPPVPERIELSPVNEIGLYYKDARGTWVPMESENVHVKSGGFIKHVLTNGIIKEDRNGVVTGLQSKLLLPRPIEFLIYAPDGVEGSEYDLLRFRLNSKDREFRTLTGGIIHSTGGAQRDEEPFAPKRIAPHTYTFTVPRETSGGEYGILPPGTGNVTNGGKIYTFAITE